MWQLDIHSFDEASELQWAQESVFLRGEAQLEAASSVTGIRKGTSKALS
jgi:hypothetical protein